MEIKNVQQTQCHAHKPTTHPRTHHKTHALTGKTSYDIPHTTDNPDVLHTPYDSSAKPPNNRRRRQPPTAPIQNKPTAIPTLTTGKNKYIYKPITNNKHTSHSQTFASNPHIQQLCQLTDDMEDDQSQTSSAPRGRRANQRYRRGAHKVTLNPTARLALTQHFAAKGRTQPPAASDPISLNISNYFSAPLGGRQVLAAVLPPTHYRTDLSSDPIYFHHPSAREDL